MRSVFQDQDMTVGKYVRKVPVEEVVIDSLAHLINADCKISSTHGSGLCSRSERYEKDQRQHGGKTLRTARQCRED